MYDKLPISAFVSTPETPSPDMDLPNLQFWNCMDYGVVAVHKQFIGSMDYELYTRDLVSKKVHTFVRLITIIRILKWLTMQQVKILQNISLIT